MYSSNASRFSGLRERAQNQLPSSSAAFGLSSQMPDAFTDPANYSLGGKPPSPTLTPSRYKFGNTAPAVENRFPGDLRRSTSTYGLYDSSRERVRAPSLYNARSSHFESPSDSLRDAYQPVSAFTSRPSTTFSASAYASASERDCGFESHLPRNLGGYRDAAAGLEEDEDDFQSISGSRSLYKQRSSLPDLLPESPVQSRFSSSAFGGRLSATSEDPISTAFANLRPSTSSAFTADLTKVECKACGEVFAESGALEDHKRVVHQSKDKPFKCQSCDMSFARKYDCDRHERIHTGERPYQCSGCGQTFARGDALSRHTMLRCTAGVDAAASSSLSDNLPPAPALGAFNRIRRSSSRVF